MNTNGQGIPIYRMNEIHNCLCDSNINKFADIDAKILNDFILNDRDVLFNRTNSYEYVGRTGIYYSNKNSIKTFASYLVRFVADEQYVKNEYLACFLNTKQAKKEIRRRARQSINQTNVNPEEVKEIELPLLSDLFQKEIANLFQESNKLRLHAELLYNQAEDILNRELGITNIENTKNYSVKTFLESFVKSKRLDAEYYQDKYTQLFDIIKNGKQLKELVTITKSIEPGSDEYKDEGIPFFRVSNLTKFGLTDSNVFLDRKKYENLLKPRKDTILFSKDGSIGIAYKAESDLDCITSGALLHLNVKKTTILPDYLTLVLNSKIVQLQAERDSGGSIINHWRLPEVERVIIPMLDYDIQNQISQKVQESFKLRKDSKNLINVAIRAIELAIEKNEEFASQWLIENTNEIYHKDKY